MLYFVDRQLRLPRPHRRALWAWGPRKGARRAPAMPASPYRQQERGGLNSRTFVQRTRETRGGGNSCHVTHASS